MQGDCVEIRVECAQRLTRVEESLKYVRENDLKHIADDVAKMKGAMFKVIIALLTVTGTALLGIILFVIKGHFQF